MYKIETASRILEILEIISTELYCIKYMSVVEWRIEIHVKDYFIIMQLYTNSVLPGDIVIHFFDFTTLCSQDDWSNLRFSEHTEPLDESS